MTFTKTRIPKRRYGSLGRGYKLFWELNEFVNMNVHCVKVTFADDEYSNLKSAQNSIAASAKRFGFPVKATIINKEMYLVRTDMEEEEES